MHVFYTNLNRAIKLYILFEGFKWHFNGYILSLSGYKLESLRESKL